MVILDFLFDFTLVIHAALLQLLALQNGRCLSDYPAHTVSVVTVAQLSKPEPKETDFLRCF